MTIKTVGLISTYPPQECGIGTYARNLAAALVKKGVAVSILGEREYGLPREMLKEPGISVYPVWTRQSFAKNILQSIKSAAQLPDILHFQHEFGLFQNTKEFTDLVAQLNKIRPIIVTWHTVLAPGQRLMPPVENSIVHTRAAEKMLHARGYSLHKRIFTIPHGITDVKNFTPVTTDAIDYDFISTGFISPSKGLEEILDAMALLYDQQFTYLIAGKCNTEYHLELRNLIINLGLEDKVTLKVGFIKNLNEYLTPNANIILGNKDGNTYSASGQLATAIGSHVNSILAKAAPIYDCIPGVDYWRDSSELANYIRANLNAPIDQEKPCWDCIIKGRTWDDVADQHLSVYTIIRDKHYLPRAMP